MKGKLPSTIMVLVALALVFSLAASVAPSTVATAQSGGLNSWMRKDLPTTLKWQMAPNTDIWDITACDDGTLLALVEDTSGPDDIDAINNDADGATDEWDGARWAVFPAYSDVSLFKSKDGGYTWTLMWHVPSSETGVPVAVVPQPGYVDGSTDVVFVAMGSKWIAPNGIGIASVAGGLSQGNLYRSMDGGASFTRVTPRCPAVTVAPVGGTITCLDVVENIEDPGTYKALVGVSSLGTGGPGFGLLEGVWTWNEDDDRDWKDQQLSNSLPPAPFTGTMPAGNGLDVIAVKGAKDYATTGCMMAVVNDISAVDPSHQPQNAPGMYVCYWDDADGAWGGDVDSPTNTLLSSTAPVPDGDYAWGGCMDIGDDFAPLGSNNVFVGLDGCGIATNNDVWRSQGLSTVMGPSVGTVRGLFAAPAGVRISDIVVVGNAGDGEVYVGGEGPLGTTTNPVCDGQAQVYRGVQMTLWPAWTPSHKPPSGAWPVLLTEMGETLIEASGGDGWTYGGVHRKIDGTGGRHVYNGIGLLDDIAVSEDIPGYANPGISSLQMLGTNWCLAEAHAMDASPMYETDKHIYVSTFSEWDEDSTGTSGAGTTPLACCSLWRWDGSYWERVYKTNTCEPVALNSALAPRPLTTNHGLGIFENPFGMWPRVPRDFSTNPYVFLLAGRGTMVPGGGGGYDGREWLWYSPDLGDTWIRVSQMPIGAVQNGGAGLSDSGWYVETDQLVLMGDIGGWIYKTTDRGASWTEGALTAMGLEVTTVITSPVYSETGASDKVVLAGTFDPSVDRKSEVWISQDGCIQDLENVGAEVNTDPAWTIAPTGGPGPFPVPATGGPSINFDKDWETNHIVYVVAPGWLDRWQLVGPAAGTALTRIDTSDTGVYRTEVNLDEPAASTWEQLWGPDDFNAIAKAPQPYAGMIQAAHDIVRSATITGMRVAEDGTLYVPFGIWDWSYNWDTTILFYGRAPSPRPDALAPGDGYGRYTAGGVLRCLDGTQDVTEWSYCAQGLGEWDGLFLNRCPVGASNTLISLAWDWQEWRFKLAIYDDTLSTTGSVNEPTSGQTGVGTLSDNQVSVTLKWGALDADVYEWQVDDDCGFTPPLVAEGTTSMELVTVTGLEPGVDYCWRVRATDPTWSRWTTPQSFTTVIGAGLLAPELEAPAAGATITETEPVFEWSAIGWATKYDIQVSTDAGFGSADLVVNKNLGDVQAYQAETDLALDTYYWHVKAKSDTTETEWSSTGVFTIAKQLPGAGTAGWVWALIVIGVILIIALIILIMRTRRPV